jgi:hypothetical protein
MSVYKTGDGIEDVVGSFGPDKRLRILVVMLDKAADGGFQLGGAVVDAAPDLFVRQDGEPAVGDTASYAINFRLMRLVPLPPTR